jgi:hypothetical protein
MKKQELEAKVLELQAVVDKAREEYKKLFLEKKALEVKAASSTMMEIAGMRVYKEDKPTKKGGLHLGYATVAYLNPGKVSFDVTIFKNQNKISILPAMGKDPKYPPVKIETAAKDRIIKLIEENLVNNTRITLI